MIVKLITTRSLSLLDKKKQKQKQKREKSSSSLTVLHNAIFILPDLQIHHCNLSQLHIFINLHESVQLSSV